MLALTCSCMFPGKMYACQYCDAVFAQSIELSRHVRTHTGDKPYVCRDCGKGFRQANGLSIHLHTFHSMYRDCGWRAFRADQALRRQAAVTTELSLYESWAALIAFPSPALLQSPEPLLSVSRGIPFNMSLCDACSAGRAVSLSSFLAYLAPFG